MTDQGTATLARSLWPGYCFALGAAACWALSATFAKGAFAPGVDPLAVSQTRSLLGFACLWPILFFVRRDLVRVEWAQVPFLALFGTDLMLMHATYYYAIARMPVAVAILVQYLAPLLVLAYLRCFAKRPVGRRLWAAAILCLAGCGLVSGVGAGAAGISPQGMAAGLVSAAGYAAYILLAEAGGRRLSGWTLLCYGLGFAAIAWGFVRPWWRFPVGMLWLPAGHAPGLDHLPVPGMALLLLLLAVFGTLVPFGSMALALRYIPAGPAGITTTAEPVIAAGTAYLLLGEALSPRQLLGGLLVIAGIVLAQWASARRLQISD